MTVVCSREQPANKAIASRNVNLKNKLLRVDKDSFFWRHYKSKSEVTVLNLISIISVNVGVMEIIVKSFPF